MLSECKARNPCKDFSHFGSSQCCHSNTACRNCRRRNGEQDGDGERAQEISFRHDSLNSQFCAQGNTQSAARPEPSLQQLPDFEPNLEDERQRRSRNVEEPRSQYSACTMQRVAELAERYSCSTESRNAAGPRAGLDEDQVDLRTLEANFSDEEVVRGISIYLLLEQVKHLMESEGHDAFVGVYRLKSEFDKERHHLEQLQLQLSESLSTALRSNGSESCPNLVEQELDEGVKATAR
eukprot:755858-Hanusia_phi.AAC.1